MEERIYNMKSKTINNFSYLKLVLFQKHQWNLTKNVYQLPFMETHIDLWTMENIIYCLWKWTFFWNCRMESSWRSYLISPTLSSKGKRNQFVIHQQTNSSKCIEECNLNRCSFNHFPQLWHSYGSRKKKRKERRRRVKIETVCLEQLETCPPLDCPLDWPWPVVTGPWPVE